MKGVPGHIHRNHKGLSFIVIAVVCSKAGYRKFRVSGGCAYRHTVANAHIQRNLRF